ncbi:hypothetical protein [Kibdelosporangium aridum]|uniref:hypothetical protein n=1 Tax=Kibdelosporangium aridum TaxID=2030 RepID=UPI0035EC58B3
MRRILSRAAVLVGGAAAAWLLSTATASAEASGQDALKPVVDAFTAAAPVEPDANHVKEFVDAVLPEPTEPPAGLDEVGRQVQNTVEKVAEHLSLPAPGTDLGSGSTPAKARLLTFGEGDTSPVINPVAATPQLAPVASAVPQRVAAHDVRRASVAESPRHAPPVGDTAPELPALPAFRCRCRCPDLSRPLARAAPAATVDRTTTSVSRRRTAGRSRVPSSPPPRRCA